MINQQLAFDFYYFVQVLRLPLIRTGTYAGCSECLQAPVYPFHLLERLSFAWVNRVTLGSTRRSGISISPGRVFQAG